MEGEIMKVAVTQGLWATLAVALIFYIIRSQEKRDIRQDKREENYQVVIKNLTNQLNVVNEIRDNVGVVKEIIMKKK